MATDKSATGVTVVTAAAELFAALLSVIAPLTLAVLVIDGTAPACGVTLISTAAFPPLAIVPTLHVTVCGPALYVHPAEAELNVTAAGSVSVSTTFAALTPAF